MKLDFKNKRVSILGAGRSGLASAEAVMSRGGIVLVSDSGPAKGKDTIAALSKTGAKSEFGGHSEAVFNCDLMIVSPGVPSNSPVITRARSKGIEVWPEIELAYRLCQGKIIGITGSNGKTTTTALIGEILKNAGIKSFVCGNIGFPFVAVADQVPSDGYAVVELSSFQLELIDRFRADISILLNITPDHLDRHGDMESYIEAKFRIFENQSEGDLAVVNYDDSILRKRCHGLKSKKIWFSVEAEDISGVRAVPGGGIFINDTEIMKSDEVRIKGIHNLSNACAALSAASGAGIDGRIIATTLESFAGVEHRLEFARLIGGVSFINDSKGTNVDSVYWALKAVSAPVILIAGGRDKAGDFTFLNELVSGKVKSVILIGEAAPKIMSVWQELTSCEEAVDMEEAVRMAYERSISGDTVLLSPGCASFDMFDNFEHRGRVFKEAVSKLPDRSKQSGKRVTQ